MHKKIMQFLCVDAFPLVAPKHSHESRVNDETTRRSYNTSLELKRAPLQNVVTPRKINMEPENDGLEDDFSFSIG